MRTYKTNYPGGKKFCSCCRRWRHYIDFGVRSWADEPHCTIARTLHSHCHVCGARNKRKRTGCKPRNWYPHGKPGSKQYAAHRRASNRASFRERYRDPEYRRQMQEYFRVWYNSRNGTVSNSYNTTDLGPTHLVDRAPFLQAIRHFQMSAKELQAKTGVDEGVFKETGGGTMRLAVADTVFTALGRPDLVYSLWD